MKVADRSVWSCGFATLTEAKQAINAWKLEYRESSLQVSSRRNPSEFACQIALKGDLLKVTSALEVLLEKADRSDSILGRIYWYRNPRDFSIDKEFQSGTVAQSLGLYKQCDDLIEDL
jgi:hypothetical protein